MQEKSVKISIEESRSNVSGFYNSLSKGEKTQVLTGLVIYLGGSRDSWKHRLSHWAGNTEEYPEMNEPIERMAHDFILNKKWKFKK